LHILLSSGRANPRAGTPQGSFKLHHYHAFGLKIASELELPELHPGHGPADVSIRFTRSPDAPPRDDLVTVEGERLYLRLWDIEYEVLGGREICVTAPARKEMMDVRIYLLGSIMAGLLHQRSYLPVHGNVLSIGGGAAAFCGDSGAGKSTLAAWFEAQGLEVLADDLCAVRFDAASNPSVFEGIPRIKLWPESLELFGRNSATLDKVASDLDKYHVPLARAKKEGSLIPGPLERIYILDRSDEGRALSIERLTGLAAAKAVLDNAFGWQLGQNIKDNDRRQFDACLAIASRCAVFRLRRRWSLAHFDEDAKLIERHLTEPLD
jgi:hypothetical protein